MKKIFELEINDLKLEQLSDPDFYELDFYAISEGSNRNSSSFTINSMNLALPSVVSKPILTYYNPSTKCLEEHNTDEIYNEDMDEIEYDYTSPNTEKPCGLIDSGDIQFYKNKNWIHLKGRLWVKYTKPIIEFILSKIKNGEPQKVSVEITVIESHNKFGLEIIDSFIFDAITLLGCYKNTNIPCEEGIVGAVAIPSDYSKSKQFVNFKNKMLYAYNNKKEGDEAMTKKYSVDDDKLGKSPSIKIKNDKDSAIMSGSWSKPSASFLNNLLEASNHTSLINEGYLRVDGNASGNLSVNDVHYPHHSLKGGDFVVHAKGCQAALSRGMAQGDLSSSEKAHLKKHYKALGLNMDNFGKFGLSKFEYSYLYQEEEENMKKFIEKAKKNGFSFLGISNNNLVFSKEKEFEDEKDKDKEEMKKMSVYEIPYDNIKFEEDEKFKAEDFKEKDLKMAEDDDGDEDDKREFEKLKEKYDKMEKLCHTYEDEKKQFEDDKKAFDELKNKFEEDKKAFEDEKSKYEDEKKTMKAETLKKETEEIMEDKDFGLDEKDIMELRKMRDEGKFEDVKKFVQEVGYRKEIKRMTTKNLTSSLSFNLNLNSKPNDSNKSDIDKLLETLK